MAFDDADRDERNVVREADRTPEERTRIHIMVDSIPESLKQIERARGKVVTPHTEIGQNMGASIRSATSSGSTKSRNGR